MALANPEQSSPKLNLVVPSRPEKERDASAPAYRQLADTIRLRKRADGVVHLFDPDNGGSLLAPK